MADDQSVLNPSWTESDHNSTHGFIVWLSKQHYWFRLISKLFINIFAVFVIFPILTVVSWSKSALHILLVSNRINDLSNRHVVITGCGAGFGRETAIMLAKMGLQVHAGVRRDSSIDELRSEYRGTNLHVDLCDVGSDDSVKKYGERLKDKLKANNLWAVINNAAVQSAYIDEDFIELDVYKSTMNVNFFGSVRMVKVCQPLMSREKGGRLIFVLSVCSYYPIPYSAAYVAPKAALMGYVNALRLEHAESKITIHSCVPGFFPTKMVKGDHLKTFDSQLKKLTPEQRQMYSSGVITKNLWAVINNAVVQSAFIDEDFIDLDVYQSAMNVNFFGSVRVVKVCQPLMNNEKGGRLIFVLSVSSYYPIPYCAAYLASKSALMGYVNALRIEHAESKITIHSCVSGFVPTKLVKADHLKSLASQLEKLNPEQRQMYSSKIISKRITSNTLQTDFLSMDNTVAMIAESLANVVVAKWPTVDFWMGWDWLTAKALALIPNEAMVWWLTLWMRTSGDMTLPSIVKIHEKSNKKSTIMEENDC